MSRTPSVVMNDFVKAWEAGSSVKDVAAQLGLKVGSVQARASKYRTEGIPLKNMKRGGGAKLDKGAALGLLAELRNTTVEVIEAEAKAKADKKAAKAESVTV